MNMNNATEQNAPTGWAVNHKSGKLALIKLGI